MMDRVGRPILIVEDHPLLRTALTTTLELSGYPVMSARDTGEALQWIEHCRPSLVVLDLHLPAPSTEDFTRELEARGYDPPIVVLTAAPGESAQLPLELGAAGHLAKPFDYGSLLAAVEQFRIP
jgi:DNA-binding response OmpR family regulator